MPTVTRDDDVDLHYRTEGDGETVAFVADAGLGAWSWGWQHRAVAGPRESLVWDLPGTGRSTGPARESVAALAADLDAVLADAGARRAHLVGLGLGGMVALEHARAYGRAASLTLIGTAAAGAELDRARFDAAAGPHDSAGGEGAHRDALAMLLSAEFRETHPDVVEQIVQWRAEEDAPPAARARQVAAALDFDARDWLHEVTHPALVLHGGADRLVPPEAGRVLAEGLPRGSFESSDGAGHLVTVERSRPVNDALVDFLDAQAEGRE